MSKVIRLTTGQTVFTGTHKECKAYKRANPDRFSLVVDC